MAVASPKSVEGIVIIAKSEEGSEMGCTHLDWIGMQNGENGTEFGMNADNYKAKSIAIDRGKLQVISGIWRHAVSDHA